MATHFLDALPMPVVLLGLATMLSLAVWLGYRLGVRRLGRGSPDDKRVTQGAAALAAMLALVSFLLGFTYSLAGGQFDTRRALVIDGANAIGTTFLRADYLPEPYRSESRDLIAVYVAERDLLFEQRTDTLMAEAETLQQELWARAAAVAREHPTPVVATYIQTLNEMIDLHKKRADIEVWVRIPGMVLATLALLSGLTMTLNGYLLALTARGFVGPTVLLILTYAMVFTLVIDLDRPARGFFSVSQKPMIGLRNEILKTLQDEKETTSEVADTRDVWREAKLRGVSFRAIGQEPGWLLEITDGSEIVLITDYGQNRASYPYVPPEVDEQVSRPRFVIDTGVSIEMRDEHCEDSMSGETFSTSVTVSTKTSTLRGCGRPLH